MCQLGGISRSGFYRMGSRSEGVDRDVDLRDAIQRIALEFPSYGRPRLTQELRRRGWQVNAKRVYRILREDNLLCLRKRKFVITTDSGHGLNDLPEPGPGAGSQRHRSALGGRHHLCSSGTGVCLPGGGSGCLLTAGDWLGTGSDAGRRVNPFGSWHGVEATAAQARLDPSLRPRRAIRFGRLHRTARATRHPDQHEPDRKPYNNAKAESFIKTLKYEEVYRQEYRDLAEARVLIGRFLEKTYNQKRLHSALGYRPPEEFKSCLPEPMARVRASA